MKIETHIQEDHQANLVVEVETEKLDAMKRRAAKKIARRVKIPGFRPGKAPYPVIVRQIGEGAIIEEAMELLVNDIYPKVIEEAEIEPYGPGSLKDVSSMDPPILEFVIPLEAEVELVDYRTLREPYEPKEISDSDVDDVLSNLQERQAVIEPAERAAEVNDLVTVRLSANRTHVEPDEDGILIKEQTIPFIVHDDSADSGDEGDDGPAEWPFQGFSHNLIGLSAEEEKTVLYTYPEDDATEAYRGIEAEFLLSIESVKSRTLPELDDEFAKSLGDYDDLDALRTEIRTTLEEQTEQAYNEEYDQTILEKTLEGSTIKYPPQMLDHEIDSVIRNLEERLKQEGLDMDLYLKTRSLDMDGLREEVTPVAESRLKQTLLLLELARAEDLQVDPNQVQSETQNTLDYYKQTLSKKEARKLSDENVYSNLMGNIMADMLMRQSMERLRAIFRGQADESEESPETAEVTVDDEHADVDEETTEVSAKHEETIEAVDSETEASAISNDLSNDLATDPLEDEAPSVSEEDTPPDTEEED